MDKKGGEWLGTWNCFFVSEPPNPSPPRHLDTFNRSLYRRRLQDILQIPHLRSPLFFHPHPADVDALKSYAHCHGRASELIGIGGVVSREWSKHQKKASVLHVSR